MVLPPEYDQLFAEAEFRRRRLPAAQPASLDPHEEAIVVIEEGRLLATVLNPSGDEALCMLREPGMLLGLEVLADLTVPYLLWPLHDTTVRTTSRHAFEALLAAAPASGLLGHLAARAVAVCLHERLTLARPTVARLAYFLQQAAGPAGSPSIRLPRNVLARILAMRPETLSRALRRLELDGAILVEPRSVQIIDAEVLHHSATG